MCLVQRCGGENFSKFLCFIYSRLIYFHILAGVKVIIILSCLGGTIRQVHTLAVELAVHARDYRLILIIDTNGRLLIRKFSFTKILLQPIAPRLQVLNHHHYYYFDNFVLLNNLSKFLTSNIHFQKLYVLLNVFEAVILIPNNLLLESTHVPKRIDDAHLFLPLVFLNLLYLSLADLFRKRLAFAFERGVRLHWGLGSMVKVRG